MLNPDTDDCKAYPLCRLQICSKCFCSDTILTTACVLLVLICFFLFYTFADTVYITVIKLSLNIVLYCKRRLCVYCNIAWTAFCILYNVIFNIYQYAVVSPNCMWWNKVLLLSHTLRCNIVNFLMKFKLYTPEKKLTSSPVGFTHF